MRILFVSSEVVPFSKTGGLADVCGSLPIELAKQGHEIIVFQPAYQTIYDCGLPIRETDSEISTVVGTKSVTCRLFKSHLPGSDVPIYLIHQPDYFDRDGLYQTGGDDYQDNCERFVFFSRAVLDSTIHLGWHPDIVHCHDWQTGLIPAYLKTIYRDKTPFVDSISLMTIHNLAYQGNFWHWDMLLTGLDWKYFNWNQMEFYGRLNLLKTGIVFADALSTVSPRYAEEIQSPNQGCGLQGVLAERRDVLTGILNGIDITRWNPSTDLHIPHNYSVVDWQEGKGICKLHLQKKLGLSEVESPLIGIIGRLAAQKGWSLILPILELWLEYQNVQWVVLGTGDREYQTALAELAAKHPQKLAVKLEFSNSLAHQIEAAADIFLMPSEYEPCGLNQQYSMRYGAVPVVHETGGLADTVVDATPENIVDGRACGFYFERYTVENLETCLARAVDMFLNRKDIWEQLVETGMRQDWSWTASAKQYEDLYYRIRASKQPSHQTV